MIQALVAALKDQFASVQNMPKLNRPIPLVLSGGTVMPPGFRDRFEKTLRETELPVAISEVRRGRQSHALHGARRVGGRAQRALAWLANRPSGR